MSERKAFLIRIDRELLDALQRWANDDLRSLNGHIEFLLRDAVRRARRAPRMEDGSRESEDAKGKEGSEF